MYLVNSSPEHNTNTVSVYEGMTDAVVSFVLELISLSFHY